MDIFSARSDGSNLRQLTTTEGYDAEGSYSPDGKKIVFCSLRSAFPLEKLSPEDRKRYETDASYFGEIYIMHLSLEVHRDRRDIDKEKNCYYVAMRVEASRGHFRS